MRLTEVIFIRVFPPDSSDRSDGEDAVQQKGEVFPVGGFHGKGNTQEEGELALEPALGGERKIWSSQPNEPPTVGILW